MRKPDDICFLALTGEPPSVDEVARPWPLIAVPSAGGGVTGEADVTARRLRAGTIEVTMILKLAAASIAGAPVEIEAVFEDWHARALDSLTARCAAAAAVPLVLRGSLDPAVVAATRNVRCYLRRLN